MRACAFVNITFLIPISMIVCTGAIYNYTQQTIFDYLPSKAQLYTYSPYVLIWISLQYVSFSLVNKKMDSMSVTCKCEGEKCKCCNVVKMRQEDSYIECIVCSSTVHEKCSLQITSEEKTCGVCYIRHIKQAEKILKNNKHS
jgi:hypothetical protein